jgi:signal transduction histidine kinase
MRQDIPLAAPGLAVAAAEEHRAQPHAWDGSMARWDVYSAAILAVTLAIVLITGPAHGRAGGAAALAAMIPWYVAVGRPAMTGDHDDAPGGQRRSWRGAAYLAGLVVLLAAALLATPQAAYILLALCPQCFMATSFRAAVVAVAALNCAPAAVALLQRRPAGEVTIAAYVAAGGLAFSVAFGTWVIKIIDQSKERAALIEQLEATRAELASAHRDAGMLAERQRISADLHDTIAQGLASIVMLLQAADSGLRADPESASAHLRLAVQTARENLAEARALVAGLAPAPLDGSTLADALRRVAAQAGRQGGITAEVEVTGPARPLPTSAEVVLLRVGQEALSNIRKHARAGRACVRLAYDAGQVRLVVTDDGAGFDPDMVRSGYGLSGMRARVAEAGGVLTVASTPSEGTAVTVTVPAGPA